MSTSVSAKETFALPRTHMISELWFAVRATNGNETHFVDTAELLSIDMEIETLTIKSGSKTFKSMSGEMCRRMSAYHTGRVPPEIFNIDADVEQECVFPIHFGLEPQDEDVILPAPLMDSLDLVVDHAFPTLATSWTTAREFDLYATVLEPTADLEEKKILIQEKKRDWTTVSSGDEPFDLTLDERRLLRRIYVQSYLIAVNEGASVSALKLKADNEEVMSQKWRNLQFQNAVDRKLDWKRFIEFAFDNGASDVWPTRVPDPRVQCMSNESGAVEYKSKSGDSITFGSSATADEEVPLVLSSEVLPGVAVIDFDRDDSMRRLQPQGIRDLDLIITQVAADAAVKVYEESLQRMW